MEYEWKVVLGVFAFLIVIILVGIFGKSDPRNWPDNY